MTRPQRWIASLVAAGCTACAPALDWREFVPEGSGISVTFPCRPDHHARAVVVAGTPVQMDMLVCSAADTTFALSYFDVKVARSARDTSGFKAARSHLTKEGKALAGSFEVGAGEIVYIGHFFLDCSRQPIPWRYYLENRDIFEKYKGHIKKRWPMIDAERTEFRLFRTKDFGNEFILP